MKYKLYNFDHGYKSAEAFEIGSFSINVTNQHCQNLSLIPRDKTITFGWDENYKKIVREHHKIPGGWIETAEVEISEKNLRASVIYPETSGKTNLDDLCLLLSFISGRFVSVENNPFIGQYDPDRYVDKVVHHGFFSHNDYNWKNLTNLSEKGLAEQFYNLVVSYQSRDIFTKALYCNNALNVAFDKWHKEHAPEFIDKEICKAITSKIDECLKEKGICPEVHKDILARVNNICNPSATFKLKVFLRAINLYPNHDTEEMNERLKWFNRVRNSIAHSTSFPKDKKLPLNILGDAVTAIISLISRINQFYFGRVLLEIDDPYLDYIRSLITPYFLEGTYQGRSVFDETLNSYMEKIKIEWSSEMY